MAKEHETQTPATATAAVAVAKNAFTQPLLKKPRTSGSNSGRRRSASTFTFTPAALVGKEGIERRESGNSTETISFTLTDAELLDCPICSHPLSSPIYQCENGHVACAACCATIRIFHDKCPSCSSPIGHIRCLFAEMIVESIKINCENNVHGCKEKVSYAKKYTHLKDCKYAPCRCPYPECDFVGFSESVYEHFSESHVAASQYFSFWMVFELVLNNSEDRIFLQEKNKKVIFVVTRSSEARGSIIKVFCIAPVSLGNAKTYNIQLSAGGGETGAIKLTGPIECIQEWKGQIPMTAYLMVPNDFIDATRQLRLETCIWDKRDLLASMNNVRLKFGHLNVFEDL